MDKLFGKAAKKAETKEPTLEVQEYTDPVSQTAVHMWKMNDRIEVHLAGRIKHTGNASAPGAFELKAKKAEFAADESEDASVFYKRVKNAIMQKSMEPGDPDAVFEQVGKLFPENS